MHAILWTADESFQSLPPSRNGFLCMPLSKYPFCSKDLGHLLGPTLTRYDLTVTALHLQRPRFQIRSHPKIRTSICLFERTQFNPS